MKVISSVLRDNIELCDRTGNIVETIPYQVNMARIAKNYGVLQKWAEMLTTISGESEEEFEKVGEATIALLNLIFGKETIAKLFEHYGDDYYSLVNDIAPIIFDFILPSINEFKKKNIELRKKIKHE